MSKYEQQADFDARSGADEEARETMTTPSTPDRLREILLECGLLHLTDDYTRSLLRAYVADERRDAARKMKERCADHVHKRCLPWKSDLETEIRALPDEETPNQRSD